MTIELKLEQRLNRLSKNIAARESAKIYQFPLWGDSQRGIPNEFARSALFAAIHGKSREYLSDHPIFSQNGFTITYTGVRLTQAHLDVFESIMHLAREVPEGNTVRFTANGLLKLIGRGVGKSDHVRLLKTLKELTATAVSIKRESGEVYWGSLLPEGAAKPLHGFYMVAINRDLIKLFKRGFTMIEWQQRKALSRKPLAQALHVWLCSHDKPYPVTVQYLHDITGSNTKELRYFRYRLKAALDELKSIGVLADWYIDEVDKVYFVKA
jgi:hypothetical protein